MTLYFNFFLFNKRYFIIKYYNVQWQLHSTVAISLKRPIYRAHLTQPLQVTLCHGEGVKILYGVISEMWSYNNGGIVWFTIKMSGVTGLFTGNFEIQEILGLGCRRILNNVFRTQIYKNMVMYAVLPVRKSSQLLDFTAIWQSKS